MDGKLLLRPLTQAVCPPTCAGLQPTCVESLQGTGCLGLLLGDASGLITCWGVSGAAGEAGAVEPQLLLSGHDAEITTLATTYPGNTGTPLIVSISADAVACAWEEGGAACLLRQHLSVAPVQGWILMPDGHHVCFSCQVPAYAQAPLHKAQSHSGPGSSGGRGIGGGSGDGGSGNGFRWQQRLLAVLEPLSLSLKGLLRPASVERLGLLTVAGGGKSEGNLALKVLALPSKTLAIGVSVDGCLVTWDFSALTAVSEGQPLTPPTSPPPSPRIPPTAAEPSQRNGSAAAASLPGKLVGACFSEDATLLLLVTSEGWALLQAEAWDGQDAPSFSRLLHLSTHHRGGATAAAAAAGRRQVSWAADSEAPMLEQQQQQQAAGCEAKLAGGVILSGAMAADRTRGDHYFAGLVGQGAVETVVLWRLDGSMSFIQVACGSGPPRIEEVAVVQPLLPAPAAGIADVAPGVMTAGTPGVTPRRAPAASGRVDVAFLGSAKFVRLLSGVGGTSSSSSGSSSTLYDGPTSQMTATHTKQNGITGSSSRSEMACGSGPQLSVFRLPYLFPALAASSKAGDGPAAPAERPTPVVLEPETQEASLASWGCPAAWAVPRGNPQPVGGSDLGSRTSRGGTGSSCSSVGHEPCVTVAALAGRNSHAAEYVAQGMSNGTIQLWPLLAYAVPHLGSSNPCGQLCGHGGAVTCLLELRLPQGLGLGGLLVSASSDGSVCGWEMDGPPVGRQLFSLHVHTDKVLQLVPAPEGQPQPWGPCLASIGADCTVALLSLRSGCCERLLHAPPGCLPHTLVWDLGRGYLAAMCTQGEQSGLLGLRRQGQEKWGAAGAEHAEASVGATGGGEPPDLPVFVLWDVQAGSLDRVVAGKHAAATMQTYLNGISMAAQHNAVLSSGPPWPSPATPHAPRLGTTHAGLDSSATYSPLGPDLSSPSAGQLAATCPPAGSLSAFAPPRPYVTASSIPHHSRGEGEGLGEPCLLAHGVLLLDIDVHALLHSQEPLTGLGPPQPNTCLPSPRGTKSASPTASSKQQHQSHEKLPAIGALDLRSSSRASLDRLQHGAHSMQSMHSGSAGARLSEAGSIGASGRSTPASPPLCPAVSLGSSEQLPRLSIDTGPVSAAAQSPQPAAFLPGLSPGGFQPLLPTHSPNPQPPSVTSPLASPTYMQSLPHYSQAATLAAVAAASPALAPASLDSTLLLALTLVHCWGLDPEADAALLRMLWRCCALPAALSLWESMGTAGPLPPRTASGQPAPGLLLDLVQPIWRDHDCFCMKCPSLVPIPCTAASTRHAGQGGGNSSGASGGIPQPSVLRHIDSHGSVTRAGLGEKLSLEEPAWDGDGLIRELVKGDDRLRQHQAGGGCHGTGSHELWCRDGRFVAERLLSIVALAKKLASRHSLEEEVCSPCNTLTTLYTLRLPELLPRLATPDVSLYAAHWQDSNDCIRDAARALMAAATDPSLVAPGHLPSQLHSFEALWEACGGALPPELLAEHSAELLCCAAACLYHDKLVTERLVSITVPSLLGLVFRAPSPLAAAAASMLAEGLASPAAGQHWKQFLGDLSGLLASLYQLADRLAALSAEMATHSHPAPHPGNAQHPHHQHSFYPRHHHHHHFLHHHHLSAFNQDRARIQPHHHTEPHHHNHNHHTSSSGSGMASPSVGPAAPGTTAGSPRSAAAAAAEAGTRANSVMACREAVGALLAALAAVDLRLFLQHLGQRLAAGAQEAAPPASTTHLLAFTALIRLMHTARGQQQVAAQLPLLVEVVMRGLDPSRPALKRACLAGVTAVLKELCMRYPHAAYHADSQQLAVALPEVRQGKALLEDASTGSLSSSSSHGGLVGGGTEAGGAPDPVAVYDLDTGRKAYQLRMDLPGMQRPRADSGALSALCFSSLGDVLMGYSDEEGVVVGWRLQKGWAQRLQRGPTMLNPAKMVVVPAAAALRAMHQTPAGHVPLGYSIKFEGPGKLRLGHHDAVVFIDLDHA